MPEGSFLYVEFLVLGDQQVCGYGDDGGSQHHVALDLLGSTYTVRAPRLVLSDYFTCVGVYEVVVAHTVFSIDISPV